MYILSPVVIIAITIVVTVALFGWAFYRRFRQYRPHALLVGGAAGTIGALLFMLPLNFCPFEVERSQADALFGVFLIVIPTTLSGWLGFVLLERLQTRQPLFMSNEPQTGMFTGTQAQAWAGVLLLPTMSILLLFSYLLMVQTLQFSTLLARFGTPRTAFVCVDNFTRLVRDRDYLDSLTLSFAVAFVMVAIGISASLVIAYSVSQPIRGARVYRTLLIWPIALSPVVTGTIFRLIFNDVGGVVNTFVETLFGTSPQWLTDPNIARWTVVIAGIWNMSGFNILFYIAGLQNVPRDLLEASAIDGATPLQQFLRIVVPMVSPFTLFLVVTNTIFAFFDTFGIIHVLTRGGPVEATHTAMYRVFAVGIEGNDLGKSAAQSLILLVIVSLVTLVQFRISERNVTYGAR